MIHTRESNGLSIKKMALYYYGISEVLLKMIEAGEVTHPHIAMKIQRVLKLSDLQAEELIPLHRRPHGGDYEPDRYVAPVDKGISLT